MTKLVWTKLRVVVKEYRIEIQSNEWLIVCTALFFCKVVRY